MTIGYLGYGAFVPDGVLTNADLERIVDTSDDWIQRRTGIRERRVLGPDETILDMAAEASRRAIADAGIAARQVTDIRVAVNTWMRFPSLATQVQRVIEAHDAAAADTAAGCAGFIYAVEEAFNRLWIEKAHYGREGYALVVGVDGLSHITNWKDRATCVLLGDGAGAIVLGHTREGTTIEAIHTHADGRQGDLLYSDFVLSCQRDPEHGLAFIHGTDAVRPYLHMDGQKVYPIAVRTMSNDVLTVIDKYNLRNGTRIGLADIDYVYPHQANLRIIEAVARKLDVPLEKVYTDGVVRYGNTSTASIPIGYCETRDRLHSNGKGSGRFEVDVAFGAGFASGAILRRVP